MLDQLLTEFRETMDSYSELAEADELAVDIMRNFSPKVDGRFSQKVYEEACRIEIGWTV